MPSKCDFELNNPSETYYCGDIITGKITLNTTSDRNVRDISIIFSGKGKVLWTECASKNNSNFKNHAEYVENRTRVFGEGVLPAGTHSYTFSISLPWECPTSFEGEHGHIRYELSLKLDRPFRLDNVYKKTVTIIRIIDLNLNPVYRIPLHLEETTSLLFSCSGRKILYTLKIPFGAYAPGQAVNYSLNIENETMADINGYSFEFIKKVTYTSETPREKRRIRKEFLLRGSFDDKCLSLSNSLFEGHFVVPPITPTTSSDSIIYVQYVLVLIMHLSGCNRSSKIKLPIMIGTVPLRESLSPSMPEPNQSGISPTAPALQMGRSNELPPNYGDLKPPSFDEATRKLLV